MVKEHAERLLQTSVVIVFVIVIVGSTVFHMYIIMLMVVMVFVHQVCVIACLEVAATRIIGGITVAETVFVLVHAFAEQV